MIEIERTRIHFLSDAFEAVVVAWAIGTLRPDNGDVYENVSEKKKKRLRILPPFFAIIPSGPVT